MQQKSTSILQIVTLTSPDHRYDSLFLSNYATITLVPELSRVPGVGNVGVFGVGQYSMRIWLDPQKLYARGLTPADVINVIQQQSQQVTAGQIGSPPAPAGQDFQYTVNVEGRLTDPAEFGNIIVKVDNANGGQITRVKDVARVELGAQTYSIAFRAEWQTGGRHRNLPIAGRQRAERGDGSERQDGRAGQIVSTRPELHRSVRHDEVRHRIDPRGLQDSDRGGGAGADRHPGVSAGLASHAGAGDHRAGNHHRCIRGDGGDGLHREPVDIVRHHPGDRHSGG